MLSRRFGGHLSACWCPSVVLMHILKLRIPLATNLPGVRPRLLEEDAGVLELARTGEMISVSRGLKPSDRDPDGCASPIGCAAGPYPQTSSHRPRVAHHGPPSAPRILPGHIS
jgi:hypothetical protein